jgi:hypothetical protein
VSSAGSDAALTKRLISASATRSKRETRCGLIGRDVVVRPQSQVEPPLASCLGGTVYDVLTNQCLASESGTQNNCRVDYIFLDKVNACVEVQTSRGYKVYAGNYFRLSGIPPARRVTVVQGYI